MCIPSLICIWQRYIIIENRHHEKWQFSNHQNEVLHVEIEFLKLSKIKALYYVYQDVYVFGKVHLEFILNDVKYSLSVCCSGIYEFFSALNWCGDWCPIFLQIRKMVFKFLKTNYTLIWLVLNRRYDFFYPRSVLNPQQSVHCETLLYWADPVS